jgi:hypothetical protein
MPCSVLQPNIDHFVTRGIYRTDRLTVRSIKMFADGALGREVPVEEPYSMIRITKEYR